MSFPELSAGFLYVLVYLTLVSSIKPAGATLKPGNMDSVPSHCAGLRARRLMDSFTHPLQILVPCDRETDALGPQPVGLML